MVLPFLEEIPTVQLQQRAARFPHRRDGAVWAEDPISQVDFLSDHETPPGVLSVCGLSSLGAR